MAFEYVITDLPAVWPGKRASFPKKSPFKTTWTKTLVLLAREIRELGGRNVEFALDLPRGATDIRQDGMLRADARPRPAVIVSFVASDGQRHRYPCDRFKWWEDNVYAIAKALEALRLVERYGVSADLVRAGFKALPASTTTALSTEAAADVIARRSSTPAELILAGPIGARGAIRAAAAKAHPDAGGGAGDFQLVQEAKRVLEQHHGASL